MSAMQGDINRSSTMQLNRINAYNLFNVISILAEGDAKHYQAVLAELLL